MIHELRATPATCFWGFFDAALPPVLRVRSGDLVRIEALTHQAGDAPDLMMDPGVDAVYRAIPIETRGPGVHVMTGPIHVEGAAPGDTLEVRVLSIPARCATSAIRTWPRATASCRARPSRRPPTPSCSSLCTRACG